MPHSTWKLHLNASSEASAQKVLSRCVLAIGRPPVELHLKKYHKGGYMATIEVYHDDKISWSNIVLEVLAFAQQLGTGWLLLSNIHEELNAVLNQENNNIRIVGLAWADVLIENT